MTQKKSKYISFITIFCLIFFSNLSFSQETWVWQNPYPQGNPLYKIVALDTSTAYAVGTLGTLMKTTDGGNSWLPPYNRIPVINPSTGLPETIENWLWSIHFYNKGTGWIVGGNGIVLKTEDGGQNWRKKSSPTGMTLQSTYFLDMNQGWAVGYNGVIIRTQDGGDSWENQFSGSQAQLYGVRFVTKDTGWVVGEGGVPGGKTVGYFLRTTNGGNTWTKIDIGINDRLWTIYYKNRSLWITGMGGLIAKSTNNGSSFTKKPTYVSDLIYSIDFPSDNVGYAVGEKGTILKSIDGGEVWYQLSKPQTDDIYSISFVDELNGWFVGNFGIIYKTRDGGLTWEQQTKKAPGIGITNEIKEVEFNNNIGWAVGKNGLILKSLDNGYSWNNLSYNANNNYNSISYPKDNLVYIVGDTGRIIKSTDGGNYWTSLNAPNGDYYNCQFIDENIGYLVGSNEKIIKTTDGGSSWNTIHTGPSIALNSVCFLNKNLGWSAGVGVILKTTNGGTTWEEKRGFTKLLSIKFLNEKFGWVVGINGAVFRTLDSGNTWLDKTINGFNEISDIFIIDSLNLYAVGYGGKLLISSNGGNSWTISQSTTSNYLNSLYFQSPSTGILCGLGGTIIRYINGSAKAMIICDPTIINVMALQNGQLPDMKYVNVNSLGGALNWYPVKDNADWYNVAKTNDNTMVINFSRTDLPPGDYKATIDIVDDNAINSPQKITINYVIVEIGKQPQIKLSVTDTLVFTAERMGALPLPQYFTISNSGGGTLEWSTAKDVAWLDLNPSSGKDSTDVIMSINTTNLPAGEYVERILITAFTAANSPLQVVVKYKIFSAPIFVLSNDVIHFSAVQNTSIPAPVKVYITNPSNRSYSWTATKNYDWYSFTPQSGTDNDSIQIEVKTTNLALGTYEDNIILTSADAVNSPDTIKVIYDILPQAIISFGKDSVIFQPTELGDSTDIIVTLSNPGTAVLTVTSAEILSNKQMFKVLSSIPIVVNNGTSKSVAFRYKPTRRGRTETILEITSNAVGTYNGKYRILLIGTCIDSKKPAITDLSTPTKIKSGSDAIISATAKDLSGIQSFNLQFKQSNQSFDKNKTITSPISNTVPQYQVNGSWTIPGANIKQNGMDFFVVAIDSSGNADTLLNPLSTPDRPIKFISIPVEITDPAQIGSSFKTSKITTPIKLAQKYYRMFSTPIIFDGVRASDLWGSLGDYRYQWRFRIPVYPNIDGTNFRDGENEILQSGVTYFLLTREASSTIGAAGTTKRYDEFYKDGIDLQPGFNFIGNPFAFDIPQSDLKLQDETQDLANSCWSFNGDLADPWERTSSTYAIPFKAWGGYCIKVFSSTKLMLNDNVVPKSLLKKQLNPDEWKVKLSVTNGEVADLNNYVGAETGAKDTYDKLDAFKPPKIAENMISLSFNHTDWGIYSGEYADDIREPNSEGGIWDFTINAEKHQSLTLIMTPENLRNNFSISVFDKDLGRFLAIKNNQVSFGSDNGVRNFKLMIGTNEFINDEKKKIITVPKDFRLYQNYPNPFNTQTNIFYHIPIDGNVKIELFNTLGKSVAVIFDGYQSAGVYEINYDAKELSSGVYFYKMTLTGERTFSASQKMILIK